MIAHEERVEICLARYKSILKEAEMDTTQNLKTSTINNRCYKILPFQYRREKHFVRQSVPDGLISIEDDWSKCIVRSNFEPVKDTGKITTQPPIYFIDL